jgi:hypothetical protein
MATASHAAGLELRQTVWAMQVLALATGLEGFERYGLVSSVDINFRFARHPGAIPRGSAIGTNQSLISVL